MSHPRTTPTLHIVGAGWAGLAAAVAARQQNEAVHLHEAAREVGGRAKQIPARQDAPWRLDNGQHILIGAYTDTLALIRTVGGDPQQLLLRLRADLRTPQGQGWQMYAGPPTWGLLKGIWHSQGWGWRDRWQLTQAAMRWRLRGFSCPPHWSVQTLGEQSDLTPRVMTDLIAPLCISALNTPIEQASARVFLRVLHDAFFSQAHGSDLLIPKTSLSELFPQRATRWLQQSGVQISLSETIQAQHVDQWLAQGDRVLLACSSWQAAKLTASIAPHWSQVADQLPQQSIATVYLTHTSQRPLQRPLMALASDDWRPAQFLFDHAQISHQPGLLAAVCSAPTLALPELQHAVCAQLKPFELAQLQVLQVVYEKRATFACLPDLVRPTAQIAPGLWACGDYVQGPYPATLEGAVRSAQSAIAAIQAQG